MDKKKFEWIKEKFGPVASWAIWDESDIRNVDIFNIGKSDEILTELKPHIVLVGLNISGKLPDDKFSNFHIAGTRSFQHLVRLVEGLKDTPLWGAYMTDVIKYLEEPNSKNVELTEAEKKKHVENFLEEIKALGVENTIIIAFGWDAYLILEAYLGDEYNLEYLVHYSAPRKRKDGNQDVYQREVMTICKKHGLN